MASSKPRSRLYINRQVHSPFKLPESFFQLQSVICLLSHMTCSAFPLPKLIRHVALYTLLHSSATKNTFTQKTLVAALCVMNIDFVYALIRVLTCETQLAPIAMSDVILKVGGNPLLAADTVVWHLFLETLIRHFNKLAHTHD